MSTFLTKKKKTHTSIQKETVIKFDFPLLNEMIAIAPITINIIDIATPRRAFDAIHFYDSFFSNSRRAKSKTVQHLSVGDILGTFQFTEISIRDISFWLLFSNTQFIDLTIPFFITKISILSFEHESLQNFPFYHKKFSLKATRNILKQFCD